jgi:predicted N-acyltransferase
VISLDERTTLGDVEPETWERLSDGHGIFVSHGFLSGLESDEDFDQSYLLAEGERREVIAGMPLYTARTAGAGGPFNDLVATFSDTLAPGSTPGDWYPALTMGARSGFWSPLLCDPRLSARERRDVASAFLAAIVARCADGRARSAGLLYVTAAALEVLAPLLPPHAVVLFAGAHMSIPIHGDDFESYIAALAPSRRAFVRRERRRFAASGCQVRLATLQEASEFAGPLLVEVDRKHGNAGTPEEERARLLDCARHLGDRGRVFVLERDGIPIAVSIGFVSGSTFDVWGWGCDYDALQDAAEYFNMIYYLPVEHALAHGLSKVRLGVRSYKAKLMRGAEPEPVYSILLHGPGLSASSGATARQVSADLYDELGGISMNGDNPERRASWMAPVG